MQADSIQPGQTVIVVDDLIATGKDFHKFFQESWLTLGPGGSATAAGELVAKQGGKLLEYLFIIELMFLKGSSKLDAPVYSIIQSDD